MPLTRISVLLVEDHPIVREGLGTLLANERDIEVAGEAANDRGAIKRVRRMGPAVVVMDIAMPQLNGLDHPVAAFHGFWGEHPSARAETTSSMDEPSEPAHPHPSEPFPKRPS